MNTAVQDDPYDLKFRPNNVFYQAQMNKQAKPELQQTSPTVTVANTTASTQSQALVHYRPVTVEDEEEIPEITTEGSAALAAHTLSKDASVNSSRCEAAATQTLKNEPTSSSKQSKQAKQVKRDEPTSPQPREFEGTVYHIHQQQDEAAKKSVNDWSQSAWTPTPTLAFARVGNERRPHRVVMDSGADLSLVNIDYLRDNIPGYNIDDPRILTFTGVTGSARTYGSVVIPLRFSRPGFEQPAQEFHIRFHVTNDAPNGMLVGDDALVPMKAILNIGDGRMTLLGQEYLITSARRRRDDPMNGGHSRDVRLRQAFTIEAGSVAVLPAKVITGGFSSPFVINPVDIGNGKRMIRGARVLCARSRDEVGYQVFNATTRPIRLKTGTLLGRATLVKDKQIRSVSDVDEIIAHMEEEAAEHQVLNLINEDPENLTPEDEQEYRERLKSFNIGNNLTADQRARVERLLSRKRKAFACDENPIGNAKDVTFDIDTGDAKPVTSPPYHASPLRRILINERIQALKEAKLIQDSNSEWSSPVIMVEQNGQYRMCIDYRNLNKVTIGDQYPVPRVYDILEALEGCHYFSSFDCNKGYYQIPTTRRAAKRLAFRTQEGLYEPLRMPFGAKGAPAAFQRMMDSLLAEGRWIWTLAYIDDVIVYSKTFDEHVKHVEWVLNQIINAGLTLHKTKSHLFMNNIDLLGHHVSNAGIAKGKKAIEALKKQKKPVTTKQMSRFLGLSSHYRRFVKNFARKAGPLRELQRRTKEQGTKTLAWTPEYDFAYAHLMEAMAEDVILAHPDYSKKFYIECDASLDGFGAVISQKDPNTGTLRPVAFISRQTVDGEKNMAATELECAGVMWALDKFRPYVEGGKVELRCDHQALQALQNYKGTCRRMQRASAVLTSYNSEIEFVYVPSKKMQHVDAFSRNPLEATARDRECPEEEIREPLPLPRRPPTEEAPYTCAPDSEGETYTVNYMWVVQPDDDIINDIDKHMYDDEQFLTIVDEILQRYDIPDTKPYDKTQWRELMFHPTKPYLINGKVLHKTSNYRSGLQIYVPDHDELKSKLLKLYHDIPLSAHRGQERLYHALAQSYFWKGISRDVKRYVRTCEKCQINKPENLLPAGLLQPIEHSHDRWGMIQMDWATKLPTSEGHDACLIVLDRLTKRVRFIPTTERIDAAGLARVMFDNVFSQFGLPHVIISDRDSRLTSEMWRALMSFLGVKHRLSTAYHQQTDGGSERVIRVLKEALRHYVNRDGNNWAKFLSRLEVAHNTSVQASTGRTPFEMDLGRLPFFIHTGGDRTIAQEPMQLARRLELEATEALEALDRAQQKQKEYYDSRRREVTYQIGDEVLLSTAIYQKTKRGKTYQNRKLGPTFWGPFKIKATPNDNVLELQLPPDMDIHPRVSTTFVRKFHRRGSHPNATREIDCVVDAKPWNNGEVKWKVRFKARPDGTLFADQWVDEQVLRYYGAGDFVEQHQTEQDEFRGGHLAYNVSYNVKKIYNVITNNNNNANGPCDDAREGDGEDFDYFNFTDD